MINLITADKKEMRIGIVGLGSFAQLHLQCLKQIEGVTVAAVCDVDPQRTAAASGEWNCIAYADWEQMLMNERLDAVHVITPESLHTAPVLASLQAGCHVFVEKPLSVDAASAVQMIRVAEETGKQLMVGHVCRFEPRYIQAKQALEEGRLGRLRSVYARRNDSKPYFNIYKRTNPVFILGIHDIDLMLWLFDSEVSEVFAHGSTNETGECDFVWAMIKFTNGALGIIENNWLVPEKSPTMMDVRMEIVGEDGIIHLQDPDQAFVEWGSSGTELRTFLSGYEARGRMVGPLLEELHHFYDCLAAGKPSQILRPGDALKAVEVAEAIILSIRTGKPVSMSEAVRGDEAR